MKILLDTDVLVYAHDPGDFDRMRDAIQILDELQVRGEGVLSAQCLAEFFSVITRPKGGLLPRLSVPGALDQIQTLAKVFQVFDLTQYIVLEAARGVRDYGLSYFDAQIWATARLNQIPVIFTEDFQDNQILDGVQFINPFSKTFDLVSWI